MELTLSFGFEVLKVGPKLDEEVRWLEDVVCLKVGRRFEEAGTKYALMEQKIAGETQRLLLTSTGGGRTSVELHFQTDSVEKKEFIARMYGDVRREDDRMYLTSPAGFRWCGFVASDEYPALRPFLKEPTPPVSAVLDHVRYRIPRRQLPTTKAFLAALGMTALSITDHIFVDNSKETSYALQLDPTDDPITDETSYGYLALVLPPSVDLESARAELETRSVSATTITQVSIDRHKVAFAYILVTPRDKGHSNLSFAIVENGVLLPPADFRFCGITSCPTDCGLSSFSFYD